jgi:glycolate oxidase iron-sulfur subunit
LFTGCVGEGLFARVNRATERVLAANGFSVEAPKDQVCCGALHAHAGDLEGARKLARQNIQAFAGDDTVPIVTNAGGCGAMLMAYGHLLESDKDISVAANTFSARVRDVGQQLRTGKVRAATAAVSEPVTYDTSCHLLYGQHAGEASLEMLQSLAGLHFVPLEGSERCCGGAGIYNLLEPELSGRVLREKLKHVAETEASVLATGNPGCLMQIGAGACMAGLKLKVCHPVELLDESYMRAGVYEEDAHGPDQT